ncbi:hypothetical protein XFLAVUS301_22510 [Xanthobacter flavus]|nr:hypothetical protein XFLAVUS301_22510 [Xanthobacter flavus]
MIRGASDGPKHGGFYVGAIDPGQCSQGNIAAPGKPSGIRIGNRASRAFPEQKQQVSHHRNASAAVRRSGAAVRTQPAPVCSILRNVNEARAWSRRIRRSPAMADVGASVMPAAMPLAAADPASRQAIEGFICSLLHDLRGTYREAGRGKVMRVD